MSFSFSLALKCQLNFVTVFWMNRLGLVNFLSPVFSDPSFLFSSFAGFFMSNERAGIVCADAQFSIAERKKMEISKIRVKTKKIFARKLIA